MMVFKSDLQARFVKFAQAKCLPYLVELPLFKPHAERVAVVVLGSAATGLCVPGSDLDMAVIADQQTYEAISQDPAWNGGLLWEIKMDGVLLQYLCRTYDRIEALCRSLDDSYIYHYGNALILRDPQGRYAQFQAWLKSNQPQLRKQRLEGKLDLLRRRFSSLEASLRAFDPLASAATCIEMIALAIKVAALLDDVPFDYRKRLLSTGLAGKMGYRIEGGVRQLFTLAGEMGHLQPGVSPSAFMFPMRIAAIIDILSEEARKQGFRVGLERPDPRCAET